MIKKKEAFEVLLEEIRDKVSIIAEGHGLLSSNIEQLKTDVGQLKTDVGQLKTDVGRLDKKIDFVHSSLKNEINVSNTILSGQIKELDRKLDKHVSQPAHS